MLTKHMYHLQCIIVNVINLEYLHRQNLKVNFWNDCRELF